MAESGKKWYVLRAVSGKEAKVKEYIDAELKHNTLLSTYVSQVLIPMEKHASLRNGKRVVKEKISLPGYVLVEAELKGDVAHIHCASYLTYLASWADWIILPLLSSLISTVSLERLKSQC